MDDNGYCNSKSNNDQLFQPRVLVLFVHGFLGSESSFCSFPLDLVQTVRKQYKIQNLEARIFPFFETKGDPEKAINSLHNWLLLNASMPEFESVIIVAHSMGGLITVDAMRKILKTSETKQSIEKKEKHLSIATVDVAYEDLVKAEIGEKADEKDLKDPDDVPLEPQQRGWFSGLWSSSSSSKEQIIHAPLDISSEKQQIPSNIVVGDTLKSFPIEDRKEDSNFYRPKTIHKGESQVNIGAIIAFDSPFYGLSSSLFTRGAGDYSADLISDYVPSNHKETVSSTLKYTTEVTANAVESIPALASSTVEAIPQATSTVVSTALLPITDPRKAAGIVLYPVKQIPYALSSVASLASSYFVKGKPEADSGTSVYQPPDDSKSLKDNTKKETGKLIENESKLEFKNGILTMSKTNSLPLSQSVANQEKLANKGSKLELKDGKLQMVQNDPANAVAEKREEDDGKTKPAELLPIPQDTDWTSWIGIGLSTAALATGAYYGGGLIVAGGYGIARTYAVTYGMKHAETARQHLSFLYPIWGETQKACDERMEAVVEEMGRGKFTFKNYYIEIPREGGGDARSFIRKPPPLTSYLFKPVGSDFGNEIGAHMNIFSREQNPGHYWNLIHQTAVDVRRAVEVARDKRF